jgi:6-phosphogluconolactonase (cycloisomerase 2 family)
MRLPALRRSSIDITRGPAARLVAAGLTSVLLASCGGGGSGGSISSGNSNSASNSVPTYYPVSVTVSGLQSDDVVGLFNSNGAQSLFVTNYVTAPLPMVTTTGTFPLDTVAGGYYAVTVDSQPADQQCTVTNGSGTVTGPVNISVLCTSLPAIINARVTGLADVTGLSLQDNGGDNLTVSSSGTYPFKTQIPSGASYSVTILSQPASHTCFVQNGNGTVTDNNLFVTSGSSNATVTINVNVICPWHVGFALSNPYVFPVYVDQLTGELTGTPGYTAGVNPTALTISPGSQFLYVVNEGDGTVSGFFIDPTSGFLSAIAGSPFTVGSAPDALAADVNGKFLYVANSGSNNISAFTINASTGVLTAVTGSPFAMTGSPLSMAVDPTGSLVYAYYAVPTAYAGTVGPAPVSVDSAESDFSIDAGTGALTPVTGTPFPFPNAPACTFIDGSYQNCNEPTAFALAPSGSFLYMASTCWTCLPSTAGGGIFGVESIDPSTGAVTPGPLGPFLGGPGVIGSIAIHPSGKFLYAGNGIQNAVYAYSIDASSGLLTPINSVVQGCCQITPVAQPVSIDPTGRFLYASWMQFTINPTTGAITLVSPVRNSPSPLAFSSTP